MHLVRPGRLLFLLLVTCSALALAGCGGKKATPVTTSAAPPAGSSSITAPANIKSAGKIIYCSDITYPPEEFYQGTTPKGSDIDIGAEIAKRMGVKAQFDNTGFDGIIAALQSKKCNLVISGMNDNADRRKQVDFVDYLDVGQSFMVRKGNPAHINTIADLAGKNAGVETGTTNKQYLDAQSKKLTAQGKKAIHIVTYPKDTDAASALKAGKLDAYFADSPVVAYYVGKDPSSFTFGGSPVNPIPVGIAVRKSDTQLRDAVQKAINAMYSDGTMKTILTKWKMTPFALKK